MTSTKRLHFQISYIQMTPNQSLVTNKAAHLIPTSNTKSSSIAIAATSSPRATTIVSTAPRKRESGKLCSKKPNSHFKSKTNANDCTNFPKEFRAEVVQLQSTQRPASPISRPGSSDGSTTVSATSSPGIDQQEQEELNALYQVRLCRKVAIHVIDNQSNKYQIMSGYDN